MRRASGNPYPVSEQKSDFPYPITDLTQNSIPYFKPDTYPVSIVQIFEKGFKFPMLSNRTSQEMEVNNQLAYSKNYAQFQIRELKPYPISNQNVQNRYPISDQNDSKTIPFGAARTYMALQGSKPPPPRHTDTIVA